jgi:solute carrier family 25 oxoglutarate transporter 11
MKIGGTTNAVTPGFWPHHSVVEGLIIFLMFLTRGVCPYLFNLLQVRMQLYGAINPGKKVPSFPALLSGMIKADGITSIYKGVDAAIGRQLVYGTARIGLHRTFSDKLVEYNDGKPINFLTKTLSGMASGSIAVCIGTPFDIALVRLQSDSMAPVEERRNYKNVFDVGSLLPLIRELEKCCFSR